MTIQQYLDLEQEHPNWALRREQMLREWMKPRIKRQSGTWVCDGRGVAATGLSPQAAYTQWLWHQQMQATYRMQSQAPARQFFEKLPCFQ